MIRPLRGGLVIGRITLLEAVRSRVLVVSLMFAVAMIAVAVAVAAVSIGERARLIIDVGLASSSALGSAIAIALAVISFSRELERHTAYPVLARPPARWEFVLGKFAGVLATMVVVVTLMVLCTALAVVAYGEPVPAAVWPSLLLACLEASVVTSVALLFSCYTGPVLAATFSTGAIIAGNFVGELAELAQRMRGRGDALTAAALDAARMVLPNVQLLSLRTQAANNLPVEPAFVGWAVVYAVAYTAAALLLGMVIFERRRAV